MRTRVVRSNYYDELQVTHTTITLEIKQERCKIRRDVCAGKSLNEHRKCTWKSSILSARIAFVQATEVCILTPCPTMHVNDPNKFWLLCCLGGDCDLQLYILLVFCCFFGLGFATDINQHQTIQVTPDSSSINISDG